MTRPTLPPAARDLARAVVETVTAARERDSEVFASASVRLDALDHAQIRLVLGGVLRSLLEELHPDGLSGDDLRRAVEGCLRSAAGWYAATDAAVLVVVLAGALGVHPGDEEERPEASSAEVTRHACLLVADLLVRAPRDLGSYLDETFREIARAETAEPP